MLGKRQFTTEAMVQERCGASVPLLRAATRSMQPKHQRAPGASQQDQSGAKAHEFYTIKSHSDENWRDLIHSWSCMPERSTLRKQKGPRLGGLEDEWQLTSDKARRTIYDSNQKKRRVMSESDWRHVEIRGCEVWCSADKFTTCAHIQV